MKRRKFLGAIGAGLPISIVGMGEIAGSTIDSGPYTAKLTGSISDPISAEEIRTVQRDVMREYNRNSSDSIGEISINPKPSAAKRVGYSIIIGDGGHVNQFYGTVDNSPIELRVPSSTTGESYYELVSEVNNMESETRNPSETSDDYEIRRLDPPVGPEPSVSEAQEMAQHHLEIQREERDPSNSELLSSSSSHNTDNDSILETLDPHDSYVEMYNKTWIGRVQHASDVWSHVDLDQWAHRTDIDVVPGIEADRWPQSPYMIGSVPDSVEEAPDRTITVNQSYEKTRQSHTTIDNWAPEDAREGDFSVSASVGVTGGDPEAGVSFSYDPPKIDRNVENNFSQGEWSWYLNSGKRDTQSFKVGDRCVWHDDEDPDSSKLTTSNIKVWFVNQHMFAISSFENIDQSGALTMSPSERGDPTPTPTPTRTEAPTTTTRTRTTTTRTTTTRTTTTRTTTTQTPGPTPTSTSTPPCWFGDKKPDTDQCGWSVEKSDE